ncbi:MAG TPA: hypothetical protein VK176_08820 [Phycisphaerales bacterium]|nr:hypothetical protein [Phycisphaerales bacterium]
MVAGKRIGIEVKGGTQQYNRRLATQLKKDEQLIVNGDFDKISWTFYKSGGRIDPRLLGQIKATNKRLGGNRIIYEIVD